MGKSLLKTHEEVTDVEIKKSEQVHTASRCMNCREASHVLTLFLLLFFVLIVSAVEPCALRVA